MSLMQMRNNDYVANKVRGAAAERRMSQAQMADILSTSRMAISRRMNGGTPFMPEELIRLADAMQVPVGAFFGEVPA